jgi:hypothetical protein
LILSNIQLSKNRLEIDDEIAKPDEKGYIAGEKIIVDEKIETGRVYKIS